MPEYVFVVRRLLRQEASYRIVAKDQDQAKKRYERAKHQAVDWSEPEIFDEYVSEIAELPIPRKPRKRRGEQSEQVPL